MTPSIGRRYAETLKTRREDEARRARLVKIGILRPEIFDEMYPKPDPTMQAIMHVLTWFCIVMAAGVIVAQALHGLGVI